jgi:hypothetical protein
MQSREVRKAIRQVQNDEAQMQHVSEKNKKIKLD